MIKFVLLKTIIQRLNKIINWQFFEFWTMQIGLPVERKYKEQFLLGSLRKQSSIECRFLGFYFLFLYSSDFDRGLLLEYHLWKGLKLIFTLRVVQTQAILCLKSISERGGSDIDRLWNLMMNFFDSKSTEDYVIQSRSMSDSPLS